MWIPGTRSPGERLDRVDHRGVAQRERVEHDACASSRRLVRDALARASASAARSAAQHARGVEEARVVGDRPRPASASSAASGLQQRRRGRSRRAASHSRRHGSRIQRPITFFRKRIGAEGAALVREVRARHGRRPRAAPSARRRRATRCPRRRRPSPASSGVPATALAVSCVAGSDHARAASPRAPRAPGRSGSERRARAATSGGSSAARQPSAREQLAVPAARARVDEHCVVLAFVYSRRREPAERQVARGRGSSAGAAPRAGSPARAWASSWKSVLNGRNWMPGAREDLRRAAPRAVTRSIAPSVRASR